MENNGWIKLHRKFLEFEWYHNIPTKILYLHCILKANYKDQKFEGKIIPKGSFITSYDILSKETGLSKQQVRSAIKRLKSTHNLTHQATSKYSLIKVENWVKYQGQDFDDNTVSNTESNTRVTLKQHTSNTQVTPIKEYKESKKERNKEYIEHLTHLEKDKNGGSKIDYKLITETWNEKSNLSKIRKLTNTRKKHINARVNDYDFDTVMKVIEIVSESKFLQGKNDRGWTADFDWVFKPTNFTKIIEGKYSKEIKQRNNDKTDVKIEWLNDYV